MTIILYSWSKTTQNTKIPIYSQDSPLKIEVDQSFSRLVEDLVDRQLLFAVSGRLVSDVAGLGSLGVRIRELGHLVYGAD